MTEQKNNCSFWKILLLDLLDFIKYIVITSVIVFIITRFFFPLAVVPSGSMEDTLPSQSIIIATKMSYWFDTPQKGDVVIFKRMKTTGDNAYYVKRIVGVPGDTVEIKDGVTYINGVIYDEPWLKEQPAQEMFGPFEVPAGQYFCMGDNRNNSYDCRYWEEHFIDGNDVSGKVKIVLSAQKMSFVK